LSTNTLHIKGHQLHYVSVGADTMPTIVFVHGSPGSWDAFEEYMQDSLLRLHYRLIAIDRPGFGYSDYGHAMNLYDECDIISSFLDSVRNGNHLFLVGHSLGGSVVPVLAANNPAIVTGIVVLAGAVDPAAEPVEKWRHWFLSPPLSWLLPGAMRPSNDELYYFKTDVLHLKEKLNEVTCKVCIVHAVNDGLVSVQNAYYMDSAFTKAQVSDTILPTGDHFIPWNHYALISKLLLRLK
ncbi:MAG TPA: alpha/beta hydrolase, partial [Chitinophagales bacterium]|nr:alpha/beta hydrolase [Chitinophagales bacterium]